MKDDDLIKSEGMKVLIEKLGLVEAGRFVSLMQEERFDYTEWRQNLFEGKTLEQIFKEASAFSVETRKAGKLPEKSLKAKPAKRTMRKSAAKRKPAGKKQLIPA